MTRAMMTDTPPYQVPARLGRRHFLMAAAAGSIGPAWCQPARAFARGKSPLGANDEVRIGLIGIGSKEAVGGVGGRGHQLIDAIQKAPGARLVALCDVERDTLDRQAAIQKDQGYPVATYHDLRRLLDDSNIDAVAVATPNHWHALATIWACQAGKDVYVEKPVSHDIWEGRQMVAAARANGRIVQAGTQARSSPVMREAIAWIHSGAIGPIRLARVILYRQRESIGKVAAPTPIPDSIDYDLWCGPVTPQPLKRKQLHYDWHWSWPTGNGEMGNNGVHYFDMCRWAMKLDSAAPRALSIGGRFGLDDDGETPNTQVAILDYKPAPIYCEIRGLPRSKGDSTMDSFRDTKVGVIFECEGGSVAGAHLSAAAYDPSGQRIRTFGPIPWEVMDTGHIANFVEAVRTRDHRTLHADVLEGHLSAACCHQVNISHRLGRIGSTETLADRTSHDSALADAIARYHEHLRANAVDDASNEIVGPWLTFDPALERFVGEHSTEANALLRQEGRAPFVVPAMG